MVCSNICWDVCCYIKIIPNHLTGHVFFKKQWWLRSHQLGNLFQTSNFVATSTEKGINLYNFCTSSRMLGERVDGPGSLRTILSQWIPEVWRKIHPDWIDGWIRSQKMVFLYVSICYRMYRPNAKLVISIISFYLRKLGEMVQFEVLTCVFFQEAGGYKQKIPPGMYHEYRPCQRQCGPCLKMSLLS